MLYTINVGYLTFHMNFAVYLILCPFNHLMYVTFDGSSGQKYTLLLISGMNLMIRGESSWS